MSTAKSEKLKSLDWRKENVEMKHDKTEMLNAVDKSLLTTAASQFLGWNL